MDPCEAMWPKKQGFQHQQDPSNAVRDICWAMSNNASNALGNSQEMRPKVEDARYGKNVEFSHLIRVKFSEIAPKSDMFWQESAFHFMVQKKCKKDAEGCRNYITTILIW